MNSQVDKIGFRNIIVCEDIREEVGNKKSLMGVTPGDIMVPSFPATIRLAFFVEYQPSKDEKLAAPAGFRLMQDDTEIAKGDFDLSDIDRDQSISFLLPSGLATFDKEASLRMLLTVNDGGEVEIVKKKVMLLR